MTVLAKPAATVNDKPVLSSERCPTLTNLKYSKSNKNLVFGPIWVLDIKTY
jgi:hypothetical protein